MAERDLSEEGHSLVMTMRAAEKRILTIEESALRALGVGDSVKGF